jgi:hypothetical protein
VPPRSGRLELELFRLLPMNADLSRPSFSEGGTRSVLQQPARSSLELSDPLVRYPMSE